MNKWRLTPSDSEGCLNFNNLVADLTLNYKDMESSDSEREPERAAQTVQFFHLIHTIFNNFWIMYRRVLIKICLAATPMNQKMLRTDFVLTLSLASPEQKKLGRSSNTDPIE